MLVSVGGAQGGIAGLLYRSMKMGSMRVVSSGYVRWLIFRTPTSVAILLSSVRETGCISRSTYANDQPEFKSYLNGEAGGRRTEVQWLGAERTGAGASGTAILDMVKILWLRLLTQIVSASEQQYMAR